MAPLGRLYASFGRRGWVVLMAWCCLLLGLCLPVRAELVVYSVAKDGGADRAGIAEGDVLLSWLRSATGKIPSSAGGNLEHPLELRLVEIEQANIAPVSLDVQRDGERLQVDLGSGVWLVKARPTLVAPELAAWQRGEQARGSDVQATRSAWTPLIEDWRQSPDRRRDAVWLSLELARVLQDAGELESARGIYEACLAAVPVDDRRLRALTLERIAAFHMDRAGNAEAAMPIAQEALSLWQEIDSEGLGTLYTLRLVSFIEMELGDAAASRASLRRQLEILEARAGPTAEEGTIYHNLGYMLWLERDLVAAEAEFRRAAEVVKELGLGPAYIRSRHVMLGVIAGQRGDLEAAELHHRELVRIHEVMQDDPANLATAYGNLGSTLLLANKLDEAEVAFRRSLEIRQRIQPDSLPLAMALVSVAQVQRRRGDLDGAMASMKKARRIGETIEPLARVNGEIASGIGRILRDRGELEAARREFESALELRRKADPISIHRANDAFILQELAYERGELEQAVTYCREAIDTLDRYRASLGGTIEQQSRYGETLADRYHSCAALLWETGDSLASFALHERGRARIQRSLLADRALRYQDADPALLHRLGEAQASYEKALTVLRRGSQEASSAAQIEDRFRRLDGAYSDLEQVLAELRQAARRQAALSEPEPASLAALRGAVPAGTLALSYSVGARDTLVYAFGPQPGRFQVFRLELSRDEIERRIEDLGPRLSRPSSLGRARLERELDELGGRLLGELEEQIEQAERLVVVPDDALYRVPFQLLRSGAGRVRLVEKIPVSISSSLSLAVELGRGVAPREQLRVAVVADPDLPEGEGGERTRRLLDLAEPLERLPATGREAELIRSLAPQQVRLFTGRQATEDRVRAESSAVEVLHLATHSIADNRSPMESALVLSEGDAGNGGSGLLQAWEIVETFDDIAPLVTLSACETGRGGEFRNEGLLGLVSALWFAGAERVVASLWQVADESTADLMAAFYRHLFDGVAADEALRRAQLAIWKGDDDRAGRDHPFYWASFQIYGALAPR